MLVPLFVLSTGLMSSIRDKEKSILNHIAILVGLVALVWIAGEVLSPHWSDVPCQLSRMSSERASSVRSVRV